MAGRFCSGCGAPAVSGESEYCARCGRPLPTGPFLPPAPPPFYPPTPFPRTRASTGRTLAVVLAVVSIVFVLFSAVFLAVRPITTVGTGCCPGSYVPPFPSVVVPQGTNYALAPGGYVDALLVANQNIYNGTVTHLNGSTETQLFGVVESAGTTPLVAYVLTPTEFSNWSARPGANLSSIFVDRANGSQLLTIELLYPTGLAYLVLWDPSASQSGVVTVVESVTLTPFSPPPPVPV